MKSRRPRPAECQTHELLEVLLRMIHNLEATAPVPATARSSSSRNDQR